MEHRGAENFRVVFLFLDGVGIGKNNPSVNPMLQADIAALRWLCGGTVPVQPFQDRCSEHAHILSVDATLGVAGLPQSGTGQVSIFTGVNGAKKFGRHFGPYPPSPLHPILAKKYLLLQLQQLGKRVVFANAFPDKFFDYIESGTRHLSVSSLGCKLCGIPLLTIDAMLKNEGISADFTREKWCELGHPDVAAITPQEAGKHLHQISLQHDFTLFEYWLTDHAGHSRDMQFAKNALEQFDTFLASFLTYTDLKTTMVVLVSDHGNIEDLSTKSHTRNHVPCIVAGARREEVAAHIKSLVHITPALLRLFDKNT
ncbi:MAG TPA: peptidase [Bacteroidota bacterium]|nr:peptidase [Bacteroidota bacterium]